MKKLFSKLAAIAIVAVFLIPLNVVAARADDSIQVDTTFTNLPAECGIDPAAGNYGQITYNFDDGEGDYVYSLFLTCDDSTTINMRAVITDPSVTEVTFAIPNLVRHSIPGNIDYSFPADCTQVLTYGSNWNVPAIASSTGDGSLAITGSYSFQTDSNGDFNLRVPYNLPDYISGGYDSQSGNMVLPYECATPEFASREFTAADTAVNMVSDIEKVTYNLIVPESRTGACSLVDNYYGTDQVLTERYVPTGTSTVEETVLCDGFTQTVVGRAQSGSVLTRGHTNTFDVRVSDYTLVNIHGHVNYSHSECLTNGVSVDARSAENYYLVTPPTVAEDGSFELQVPNGTWIFSSSGSVAPYELCTATTTVAVQGSSDQNVTLTNSMAKINVQLTQPAGHDDCIVSFDGEGPTQLAVPVSASTTIVPIVCGPYTQNLRVSLASLNLNDTDTFDLVVQAPSLNVRHIQGTIKVPSSMSTGDRSRTQVFARPDIGFDFSEQGWNQPGVTSTITWTNSTTGTYSLDVPVGKYNFGSWANIETPLAKGCYAESWYKQGANPEFAQQYATLVDVPEGTGNLTGPSMTLTKGDHPTATFTWPAGTPAGMLTFDLFTKDKQPYLFNYGDGVMSDAGHYSYTCLPPGTYYFRFSSPGSPYVGAQYSGAVTSLASAKPIVVKSDGTSTPMHFDFVARSSASISGTVVDELGNPLSGGYTVYASNDNDSFASSVVDSNGNFNLKNLEDPSGYSLVVASNSEFSYGGSGGVHYAFYGGSHDSSSAKIIQLTSSAANITGLKFVYSPASTTGAFDDVVPWNSYSKRTSPAVSITQMSELINSGSVAVDSRSLTTSQISGLADLSGTSSFSGLADTSVDVFVLNSSTVAPSAFRRQSVTPSPVYVGRVTIVEDQVVLNSKVSIGAGLNEIILVGQQTGTSKVIPLVAGALKPFVFKNFKVAGTLKKNKTLSASGVFAGNPSNITSKYIWSRCSTKTKCRTISGATKSTYKAKAADVGKYLKVQIKASNSAGKTSSSAITSRKIAR